MFISRSNLSILKSPQPQNNSRKAIKLSIVGEKKKIQNINFLGCLHRIIRPLQISIPGLRCHNPWQQARLRFMRLHCVDDRYLYANRSEACSRSLISRLQRTEASQRGVWNASHESKCDNGVGAGVWFHRCFGREYIYRETVKHESQSRWCGCFFLFREKSAT